MNKTFVRMDDFYGDDNSAMIPCPVCGKMFRPAPEHAYYIGKNKRNLCCTYSCMRNYEKNKKTLPVEKRTKKRIPVRIIETGETFESIKACAKHLDTACSNVNRAAKYGYTCKGYHLQEMKEGDVK